MISSAIGGVLLLIGVILLVIKCLSVEYIDAGGALHENFFLLPLGFLYIFCGLVSLLFAVLLYTSYHIYKSHCITLH